MLAVPGFTIATQLVAPENYPSSSLCRVGVLLPKLPTWYLPALFWWIAAPVMSP